MVTYSKKHPVEIQMQVMGAYEHMSLMKAIVCALWLATTCPEKYDNDAFTLIPLFDLLDDLIPGEEQLRYGDEVMQNEELYRARMTENNDEETEEQ